MFRIRFKVLIEYTIEIYSILKSVRLNNFEEQNYLVELIPSGMRAGRQEAEGSQGLYSPPLVAK